MHIVNDELQLAVFDLRWPLFGEADVELCGCAQVAVALARKSNTVVRLPSGHELDPTIPVNGRFLHDMERTHPERESNITG